MSQLSYILAAGTCMQKTAVLPESSRLKNKPDPVATKQNPAPGTTQAAPTSAELGQFRQNAPKNQGQSFQTEQEKAEGAFPAASGSWLKRKARGLVNRASNAWVEQSRDPNTIIGAAVAPIEKEIGDRGQALVEDRTAATLNKYKDYFLKGDGRKWLMGAGGVGLAGLALPLLFGGRGGGGGNAQQMQMLQQQNAMLMQMMQQGRGGNWQNQMPVANRGWRQ